MRTSESTKELVGALSKAQAEFPKVIKDAENPYFKSKYADLSSIVNAVQDTLGRQGLAVTQHLETDTQTYFDEDGTVKGEKLLLVVTTRIEHVSGEFEESTLKVPLLDAKPQTLGSASTYVRRYALQSILRVAAESDDDGNASSLNENWGKDKRDKYVQDKTKKLQEQIALQDKVRQDEIDEARHSSRSSKLKEQLEASVKDLVEAKRMDDSETDPHAKREDPGLISDAQVKMIFTIAGKRGLSEQDVFNMLGSLGYEHLRELPRSKVTPLLDEMDPDFRFHHRQTQ